MNTIKQSYEEFKALPGVLCSGPERQLVPANSRDAGWYWARDKFLAWLEDVPTAEEISSLLLSIAAGSAPRNYQDIAQLTLPQWLDDLADLPKGAVQYAWQQWRRQAPGVMPSSAAIRNLCLDLIAEPQAVYQEVKGAPPQSNAEPAEVAADAA